MNESERQQFAQKLSALSWRDARKEIYKLDRDTNMKYYRNSYWDEYQTLFVLPNAGVSIILVEKTSVEESSKPDFTGPKGRKRNETEFSYTEARVIELERPASKRGGEERYQFK